MNSSVHVGLKARVSHRLGVLCIWCWPPQYIARCIHRRRGRWIVETARGSLTRQSRCVQGTSLLSLVDPSPPSRLSLCLSPSLSLPPTYYPENYVSKKEWKAVLCSVDCKLCVCVPLCFSGCLFCTPSAMQLCRHHGFGMPQWSEEQGTCFNQHHIYPICPIWHVTHTDHASTTSVAYIDAKK